VGLFTPLCTRQKKVEHLSGEQPNDLPTYFCLDLPVSFQKTSVAVTPVREARRFTTDFADRLLVVNGLDSSTDK